MENIPRRPGLFASICIECKSMILFNKQKQYFNNTALMQHATCFSYVLAFDYIFFSYTTENPKKTVSCGDPRLISSGQICLTSRSQTEAGHLNHH